MIRAMRRIPVAVCVCALALAGPPVMAQEVMSVAAEQPGFKASQKYGDMGNGESVNPFSGSLIVTHASAIGLPEPSGGALKILRVYNSKSPDGAYPDGADAERNDKPHGVLGINWTLTYGRVLTRLYEHSYMVNGQPVWETRVTYFYQDETGAEHRLYRGVLDNWAGPTVEPVGGTYYTNDASFLRATYSRTTHAWQILYPDGSVREALGTAAQENYAFIRVVVGSFNNIRNSHAQGWYVTSIADRAGNVTAVTYNLYNNDDTSPNYQPYAGSISTIADPLGRTVTFSYDSSTHLLSTISCGGKSESYEYIPNIFWNNGLGPFQAPSLSKVTDPEGLETLYRYEPMVASQSVLKVVGTNAGGQGTHFYNVLASPDLTIQAGDILDYDIYINSSSPESRSGLDLISGAWSLRGSGAVDQNGIAADPASDLTLKARGKWYHRRIILPAGTPTVSLTGAGNGIFLAMEGDSAGNYTTYTTNIFISRAGVIRLALYRGNTTFTYPDDTGYSFGSGYAVTFEGQCTGGVAPGGVGSVAPVDYLAEIRYPTGGISKYAHGPFRYKLTRNWYLRDWEEPVELSSCGVISHSLLARAPGAPSEMWNLSTWSWYRTFDIHPCLSGYTYDLLTVLMTDPLGTQTASYFAADDDEGVPAAPGTEVATFRRLPGTTAAFDHHDPMAEAVSKTTKSWAYGDAYYSQTTWGDSHLCTEDTASSPVVVSYGNPHMASATEAEYEQPSGTMRWQRTTDNYLWDGYGHYRLSEVSGTPAPSASRVSGSAYTLIPPQSGSPYQLDRKISSFEGEGTVEQDPENLGFYGASGQFKDVRTVFDSTTGLPTTVTENKDVRTSFRVRTDTLVIPQTAVPSGSKVLDITYTTTAGAPSGKGAISRLQYSGGDSSAVYGFNFTWSNGAVAKFWRGPSSGGTYSATNPEWTRTVDTFGRTTAHTDANGFSSSYAFDGLDRLVTITPPSPEYSTRIAYPNDTTTFDGVTWATGHAIRFYKGAQSSVPVLSPGGSTTGLAAGDSFVHYEFDDLGRLWATSTVMPDDTWSQALTLYDPVGKAVFSSLPFGYGTKTFSSVPCPTLRGDLTTEGDPVQAFALYAPAGDGTCYFGSWTSMYGGATCSQPLAGTPEPLYRALWSYKPDGSKSGTAYSGLSRTVTLYGIETESGAQDSATTYTDDLLGKLLTVDVPVGADATYTYDGLGRLTGVSLAASGYTNQTRSFTYDALGRVRTAVNPENGSTAYLKYDCIGNLLEAQDAAGGSAYVPYKIVNEYDTLGRQTYSRQVKSSDGTTLLTLLENTYSDTASPNKGKLIQSIARQKDQSGNPQTVTTAFTYLASTYGGRLSYTDQTVSAWGTGAPAFRQTYAYDSYGQVGQQDVAEGATTRGSVANTFAHGAVESRAIPNDRTVLAALRYTAAGALDQVTFDTGAQQEVQFDQYLRPSGFRMSDGANTLWGNGTFAAGTYAYDGAGNIKSIAEPTGITDTFKYDQLSRLTKANVYKGTALHIYDYAYDPYGNLTQRTEDPQGFASVLAYLTNLGISSGEAQAYIKEVMFSATVGPASGAKNNRLNVVTRGGTIGGKATGITQSAPTMVYDQNGNLTDDGQYVYKYDCLNRQVAVYLTGGSTLKEQYFYDSAGERVAAVESTGATLLTFRQFVRDGAAVLYEKKWDRSGSTWVASSDKLYVYAGGRMAATKETAGAGTTYTYYAVDHLGTVRYSRTLDPNGTLVTGGAATYKAEPFGVMIPSVTGSPNGNTHFYTGHERDTLPSGFNQDYMHFRYYGSSMGRFFKPDSQFDGTPGNSQGWNLYGYARNNPTSFSDPSGHQARVEGRPLPGPIDPFYWFTGARGFSGPGILADNPGGNFAWVTATVSMTIPYAPNASLVATVQFSMSTMYDLRTMSPVMGTQIVESVQVSITGGHSGKDGIATEAVRMTMTLAPNPRQGMMLLAAEMSETWLGTFHPTEDNENPAENPGNLVGSSNTPAHYGSPGALEANLAGCFRVLAWAESVAKGNVWRTYYSYNGNKTIEDNGKEQRVNFADRTTFIYEQMMQNMEVDITCHR